MKKMLLGLFVAFALSACGQQTSHTGYPNSSSAPVVASAPACENCCVVKMKDGRNACVMVENGKIVGKGNGCTNATKMCQTAKPAKKASKKKADK